jgi:hypothetical protein
VMLLYRFLWELGTFSTFLFMSQSSASPRSCIGRRFTEVESVAVLSDLVTRYTIHLTPESENALANLAPEDKIKQFFNIQNNITLT